MDNIVMGTAEGDSGEEGEIEETSHTPTQEDLNEDIQSILQRNVLVTTSNAVQEDRIHQIVHKYGINRLNEYRYTSGRHENGITHMCVTKDRLDVLRLLVKCGLDLNAQRPSDGSTCAHVAVRAKQNTMVNELRTLGADLTIRNKYGEVVESAAPAPPEQDLTNQAIESFLHSLFSRKRALEDGENEDNPDKANEEAIADEKKVVSAVDTLMNTVGVERVKAWRKQYYTDSLIHQIVFAAGSNSATSQALQRGITALERLVSTHGMDINSQRGSDGCTPAHISACMRRNGTLLNKLVSLGADLSVEDASGTSVRVQDELWRRSDELAEAMLPLWESDIDLTTKNYMKKRAEEIDNVIERVGLDVAKAWRGQKRGSLLHEAVNQDKADVLERLVTTHGFNINVQKSMDKMTPAHLSVWLRKHHLTDLLRKLGADCDNVINKYGESVDGLIAMHKRKDNLVWMDLEFTSLTDPEILEVAVIITDGTMEKELARQRWVIHASEAKINSLEDWHQRHFCDVQDGGNGLFSECLASEMSVEECEQELLVLLSQHCEERQNCLAGSSVHCDRQVLNTQMPAVYKFLSHQIIDVSTFIGAARRWRPALSDPREYQRNKAKKARRMAENLSKSVVNDSKSAEDDSKSAESDSKLAENGTNEAEKELKSSTDAEDGVVDDSIAAKKGVASDVSGAASEYDGHRAMADIERSIEVGRWARDVFFNPVDSS